MSDGEVVILTNARSEFRFEIWAFWVVVVLVVFIWMRSRRMGKAAEAVNHLLVVVKSRDDKLAELAAENAKLRADNVALKGNQYDEADNSAVSDAKTIQ